MIMLSDYVIDFLTKKGIKDIFLVSGGGIMYLLDSIGRNKKIRYTANHHEQASAISAEAYARVKNNISACLVTTGPGGTNAITGVAGAWVDSIPIIVISGQVKRELISDYKVLRQCGPQEINIIDIVKPITKYAKQILNPNDIKYELEKAIYIATSNRPGPVWLDIPLDIQSSEINVRTLKKFTTPKSNKEKTSSYLDLKANEVVRLLKNAKRPVIISGNGIRLSNANKKIIKLINKLKIPVITDLNGIDIIPHNNPMFMGIYGPSGYRSANLVLQNSDLILCIGSSLNAASTGFNFDNFAPKAIKILNNIDPGVFEKSKINIDLEIISSAHDFLEKLCLAVEDKNFNFSKKWLSVCKMWKKNYPTVIEDFYKDKECVNSYIFFDKLSRLISQKAILTTGIGLDVVSFYQAFKVKTGQRSFVNKNFGQMGWCLPAAIGACIANGKRESICVTGDGSFQMNIQELATIDYYRLPIKIFLFNNKGYKTIRDMQNNLMKGRIVGADSRSGVSNPRFDKIAQSYNFKYFYMKNNSNIENLVRKTMDISGPVLCEVNIAYDQERMPRATTYIDEKGKLRSRLLEDMFPLLSREELYKNMHFFDEEI